MASPFYVEYQNKLIRGSVLARRIGVSTGCIRDRWRAGLRGEQLAAPPNRGRRPSPDTIEKREELVYSEQVLQRQRSAAERSRERRRRAKERAAQLANEIREELNRPLIDARLLTKAERREIARKIKGVQRWNGGWFGESDDSRESGR